MNLALIDTAKLQVLGQIEMAKPRSDDMKTFQISLYIVKDPELLKDGPDSSHHLRDMEPVWLCSCDCVLLKIQSIAVW